MNSYVFWIVYDTEVEESISESVEYQARNFKQALSYLLDPNYHPSKYVIPKDFEIHLGPTLDANPHLTQEDISYLKSLDYAF